MPIQNWSAPPLAVKSQRWETRNRTWTRTPGYRTIPKVSLPMNPYFDERIIIEQQAREDSYFVDGSSGLKTVVSPAGLLVDGDFIKSMLTQAIIDSDYSSDIPAIDNSNLIKTLGKASDAKVNLAVTLAEAGKAVDLVLSTATRLYRAYGFFRRGRLGDLARTLGLSKGTVHKTWLEYKYGWMPMLMDVHGAAEALAQHHVGRPPRFSVSNKSTMPIDWRRTTSYGAYGGGTASYTETLTGEYEVKHKMTLEVVNSTLSTAQQLGLTNPALVVWELVPFSFVFDWFISVGDYLGALTALQGLDVKASFYSGVVKLTYTFDQPGTVRYAGSPSTTYVNASFNISVPTYRYYARLPFTPSVGSIYPPRSLKPLNWQKAITSLALLKANAHRLP